MEEVKISIERFEDGETKENESFKKYIFKNLNFSIVNGLRRTIISDIPMWVFNGLPNLIKDNKEGETVKVIKNTTRLNNEIIKQRLSCIPIHLDSKYDYSNLVFTLNVSGKDNLDVKYITTKDFEIYENIDKKDKKDITDKFNHLPKDNITGDHIIITRLNPKISNQIPGEELNLTCRLTKHTAKENGCFNSVSCCSYSYLEDTDKQEKKME